MRLSLWESMAVFVISPWTLQNIAKYAQIPLNIIQQTAMNDKWQWKRDKFKSLSKSTQRNLESLDLLLDGVLDDPSRVEFLTRLFEKVDNPNGIRQKEQVKGEFISRLSEFMSLEDAERLYSQVAAVEGGGNVELPEKEVSPKDKIEAMNEKYKFFSSGLNEATSEIHDIILEAVRYHRDTLKDLVASRPHNYPYEQRITDMRNIAANSNALRALASLYCNVSGVKAYVDPYAATARLFADGHYIIRQDELNANSV